MHDINAIVTKNFNDNIAYIEQHHPELFAKLSEYDAAVSNGHYKERYELVFENGNFDVLEKTSGNYLYDKKTDTHTTNALQSVDFSTQNNCFEGFVRQSYSQERVAAFEKKKQEQPLEFYASYVADILHETEETETKELKSIDKYIFFGVGLGLHISAIAHKVSAKVYLIVEDDLELFRLSLFCTNYKELAKGATLFFSVFEDDTEFAHTAEHFLQESHFYNHFIKYFQLLSHSDDKTNKFYVAISTHSDLKFLFHDYMKISISPLESLSSGYNILLKDTDFQKSPLKETPFLLVASGPSLQKNIEFLKKNKHNFVIVAVSSALKYLEMHNVVPDIVIHLDPFDASLLSFEKLEDISFLDNSLLFLAASSPKKLFKILKKENIFLYEAGSNYKADAFNVSAPCIGSLSYMLLLALKVGKIYLLGLDLAVDSETGLDHTAIHQDTKQLEIEDVFSKKETLSYKEDLFEIEGNFTKKVYTTAHFYSSVSVINRYMPKFKKEFQKIYNLSDGALFNTAAPLHAKDIGNLEALLDNTKKELKDFLLTNAEKELNATDKKQLKGKLTHAESLYKQLKEQQINNRDAKEYAQNISKIITKERALYKYELARVLDSYLYYILNFVYNHLHNNNSDLKEFYKIDKLLKNQLYQLISYYTQALKEALSKEQ